MTNLDKNPLAKIADQYECLVIGGGIVGAGIFRDLSLHNVNTLLVDKYDFSSQTSSTSSKMLHGGIRYLETYDFGLVWEALHEKNLWLKIAPHLAKEIPFSLPCFKDSKTPQWMLKVGLSMYDALSAFKNSNHYSTNLKRLKEDIPFLKRENLLGAEVYFDAIVDDTKLTLENIYDALKSPTSEAISYIEVIKIEHLDDYSLVTLKDTLTGESRVIKTLEIIFATGPFTDELLDRLSIFPWKKRMIPSKGSHIILPKERLPLERPIVMMPKDGRVIFVIPQENSVLVGTTEKIITGNLFNLTATKDEIDYLLENINEYFPDTHIINDDILFSFAGVRPLVKSGDSEDLGKTSRHHKIIRPKKNIHVIIGGKLTTFRTMGQKIVKRIVKKSNKRYNKNASKESLRQKSIVISNDALTAISSDEIISILKQEHVRSLEDLIIRRLGVKAKALWKIEESFEGFFINLLDDLNRYMNTSKEEILNFWDNHEQK